MNLLRDGDDIRTVRELPRPRDVSATMIYIHLLNRGPAAVRSPATGCPTHEGQVNAHGIRCSATQHILEQGTPRLWANGRGEKTEYQRPGRRENVDLHPPSAHSPRAESYDVYDRYSARLLTARVHAAVLLGPSGRK